MRGVFLSSEDCQVDCLHCHYIASEHAWPYGQLFSALNANGTGIHFAHIRCVVAMTAAPTWLLSTALFKETTWTRPSTPVVLL